MLSVRSGIGEALELDAEVLADDAARAFAADDDSGRAIVSVSPAGLVTVRGHAVGVLRRNAVKVVDSRRSISGCALASFSASSTILMRSHCST